MEIEFISKDALAKEGNALEYILSSIEDGQIVVLEQPLDSESEKTLISKTMDKIDSKFSGIEISTLRKSKGIKETIFEMLGERRGLTVIGPAKLVKEIKQNPEKINWKTK